MLTKSKILATFHKTSQSIGTYVMKLLTTKMYANFQSDMSILGCAMSKKVCNIDDVTL